MAGHALVDRPADTLRLVAGALGPNINVFTGAPSAGTTFDHGSLYQYGNWFYL